MPKALISLLVLVFLLILPDGVQARLSSASPSPVRQIERQEVKERVTSEIQERKEILNQTRQERITKYFGYMLNRFEAAVGRLEKLIERIQSRIDTIKVENPDQSLTNIQSQLDNAKEELESTKTTMEGLNSEVDNLLSSDDPKTVFKVLGKSIRDLKQSLVEIHSMLVDVIGDLKGLRVGNEN